MNDINTKEVKAHRAKRDDELEAARDAAWEAGLFVAGDDAGWYVLLRGTVEFTTERDAWIAAAALSKGVART